MNALVVGLPRLLGRLGAIAAKKRSAVSKALRICAYMVQGTARKKILRDPKTGLMYGKHQASAPGEAPANDTGNLARNINVLMDANAQEATVISRAPYSLALELGSYRKVGKGAAVYTAPRPFLGPSLIENMPEIKLILNKAAAS